VEAVFFFGPDYEERATLRDGTRIVLRAVRSDDKDRLRRGFLKLSPESRYLRFFAPKLDLSEDELRYLTEVDGVRHFAIGAVRESDGEGLGVARFIRLEQPEDVAEAAVAEAAIAVLDEMQGKGLGSLLFLRLVAAAEERGLARFRCELLGSNKGMSDFLATISAERKVHIEQGVMSVEFALPNVPPSQPLALVPRESSLYKFFTLVAQGEMDWRDAVAQLTARLRAGGLASRVMAAAGATAPSSTGADAGPS
jgi:GNAT superfamily N-acetyltransferase